LLRCTQQRPPPRLEGTPEAKAEAAGDQNQTMIMNKPDHNADDLTARRKSARRTALWIAAIAITIYVVFILSGTMGK
jgi:hypothetical protein